MMNRHQQLGQALNPRLRRRGFSLLELSVVLGIISLIAGAGVSMASGALKTADRIATQEKLATIKLALDSHARIYGYLPCPADRKLKPTDANFGIENRNSYSPPGTPSQTCSLVVGGIVSSSNVYIGAVPVRSLGLPDSYASDSWGNKLTYAASLFLTRNAADYSTVNGNITVQYRGPSTFSVTTQRSAATSYTGVTANGTEANLTIAGHGISAGTIVHVIGTVYKGSYTTTIPGANNVTLTGSTYSVNEIGTIVWQFAGNAASYVVVSHGPDGRGAYPTEANAIPATKLCTGVGANTSPPPCTDSGTTTCLDIRNCDDDSNYVDADYNDGAVAAQYFDDFIIWGSSSLVRTAVNDGLYTSATTSTCPTGVCEPWCAACTKNFPGAGITLPVATTTGAVTNPILCRKVLSSSATTCTATCFWGGTNLDGVTTASSGYQKCP